MKKAIGKMNKAELLELAKENRDLVRGLEMNITMLSGENEALKIKYSILQEAHIELKQHNQVMKNKLLDIQSVDVEPDTPEKQNNNKRFAFWRNLFS